MKDPGIKHIPEQRFRDAFGNCALGNAALAIGSTPANVATGAVDYAIDGVCYTKATVAAGTAFTDTTVQGASTFCKYLVTINAAGTIVIVNGTPAATAAEALLPDCTDDTCALGYVQVATSAAGSFTPATTSLAAANVTDTYVSLVRHNGL